MIENKEKKTKESDESSNKIRLLLLGIILWPTMLAFNSATFISEDMVNIWTFRKKESCYTLSLVLLFIYLFRKIALLEEINRCKRSTKRAENCHI